MKTLKAIIFTIFHPSYWLMNHPYSEDWDRKLNALMDKHDFIDNANSDHSVTIGGVLVWTSNHPYAQFHPHSYSTNHNFRPSRLTIHRANKKLMRDMVKNIRKTSKQ